MSEFQTATENFLKWFKSVGGEFRDDLLEITDLRSRGAGRGIRERASQHVKGNEHLLTLHSRHQRHPSRVHSVHDTP
jgi:hypothetical protein